MPPLFKFYNAILKYGFVDEDFFYSLLSKRFAMDPDEAAKGQPEFELALRERMRQLECDLHKTDFERMDMEVAGVISDGKRFRFKKKLTGTIPQ